MPILSVQLPPPRRRRRHGLVALSLAMLPAFAPAASGQAIDLRPCTLRGVEYPALCGGIERALDPARPDGRRITVQFALLPALARRKKADAVFFLAGGPGQSAIELAGPVGRLLGRVGQWRDVVLVDQRGTGRSAPLSCDDARRSPLPLGEVVEPAAAAERMARCREALERLPHGDLRQYATWVAMQDVDAVRRALGLERINLVGVSYGTRAALDYLRQFPLAVRRVVLDGVAPPDMALPVSSGIDAQAALDGLLDACDADPSCRAAYPRLRERLLALARTLPRPVTLVDPASGRERQHQLGVEGLAALVRGTLYSPLSASALPAAIAEAENGRWSALTGLAAAAGGAGRTTSIAEGQHFSVVCAEDLQPHVPTHDPAGASPLFATTLADVYRRVCADWPRAEVPPGFRHVGPSASPVLLLSGAADPVTPPRHGQRMALALGPKARHVVVPNAGHGVMALPCLRALVYRFIDEADEAAALAADAGCAEHLPRPPTLRRDRASLAP